MLRNYYRLSCIRLIKSDIITVSKSKIKKMIQKIAIKNILYRFYLVGAMFLASFSLLSLNLNSVANAIDYQSQINALESQNQQTQNNLNSLQSQATNYQQVISQDQAQINSINYAISVNSAKEAYYKQQIVLDNQKIAQNKNYLATAIKTLYIQGQMSTIEQLATSNSLSSFVTKQEDDISIQNNLNSLLGQIKQAQLSAENNANQVSALIQTENSQQNQVTADQNQVNQLLAMNQQQQNNYNAQLAAANAQIAQLQAEQAAADASIARNVSINLNLQKSSSGSGGACDIGYGNGGYPSVLCNTAQDAIVDSAGFPNRECTSFANWYFTTIENQPNFQVTGNAGWWFETSNYPVSVYPNVQPGAIGIEPSSSLITPVPSLHGGYYGHVMIVLALPNTTYDGSFPYTSNVTGTYVPAGYVLVMSMNEDFYGHFMYNLWPDNYLMYINPQ